MYYNLYICASLFRLATFLVANNCSSENGCTYSPVVHAYCSDFEVILTMTVDQWASEASWELRRVADGTKVLANQGFPANYATTENTVTLGPEYYCVDVYDDHGDGGIQGSVEVTGQEFVVQWASNAYTNFGSFCFDLAPSACVSDSDCPDEVCTVFQCDTAWGWCSKEGVDLDCDDGLDCTEDTCDNSVGCVNEAQPLPCSDGDPCTSGDMCVGTSCIASGDTCDDGNECTTDSCATDGSCSYINNTESCDDGDVCTEGDYCNEGSCTNTGAANCDDDDSCTEDHCEPGVGCVYEADPPISCDQVPSGLCCCGNGDQEGAEDCDDDNEDETDGCSIECAALPLPPADPVTLAPEPERTVAAPFSDSISFLYSGPNAIQVGADEETFKEKLVAVVRGRVLNTLGEGLCSVTISVKNHPEYGKAVSREDGYFDFAINSYIFLVILQQYSYMFYI